MGQAEKKALPPEAQRAILEILAAGDEAHIKLVRGAVQVIAVRRTLRYKEK